MVSRSIGVHLFLFVGASVLALQAWTAEDEPQKKHVAAELWSARPSELERIEFETPKNRVTLEPKSDAAGRYFVGTVETLAEPEKPATDPAATAPDAGAAAAEKKPEQASEPQPPERFVSLDKAISLADELATLRASRVLGKVGDDRLEEFGFDDDEEGRLTVTIGGRKRVLAFGDKTPGGRDRYARDAETGEGYVISGSLANDLIAAKNRLVERSFHDFGEEKIGKVVITSGERTRELVPHATEKNFWAAPDSPEEKDETASNWMTKVERLRVTTYLEEVEPAPTDEDRVARIEYFGEKGKSLGFLELVRRPGEEAGERNRYAGRSERTRWYATVLRSTAEQIDQDLGSVLEP